MGSVANPLDQNMWKIKNLKYPNTSISSCYFQETTVKTVLTAYHKLYLTWQTIPSLNVFVISQKCGWNDHKGTFLKMITISTHFL